VPFVSMIHSVDSLKLLAEINRQAAKIKRVVECLLQFHIAAEESKFGIDLDEADLLLDSAEYKLMRNVTIRGVMGMATYTNDMMQVRNEFRFLKQIFGRLKSDYFRGEQTFSEISMGMSGDFQVAVEEGSTMLRIGTAILGER